MRVAILTHGGLENPADGIAIPAMVNLIKQLAEQVEVDVLSLRGPSSPEKYVLGKAEVNYLPASSNASLLVSVKSFYRSFAKRHRQAPFSLILGFWALPAGFSAVLLGKRFRLPTIVALQGAETADLPDYGFLAKPRLRRLLRWTTRSARSVTCLSQFQAEKLWSAARVRSTVIPFGASSDFRNREFRMPTSPYRLLHVGHQNAVKDQAVLLQATAELNKRVPVVLDMVGGDYLDGAMPRLARRLGIASSVIFHGHVANENLPRMFSKADLLMHTSRYEAQGVVFAEAFAAGVPICATRVGLGWDLAGTAVESMEVGDVDGLVDAAQSVLEDPNRQKTMREAGFTWDEAFGGAACANAYLDLFQKVTTP